MRISTLFALALALATGSCTKTKAITKPFVEDFERAELGSRFFNTGGPYEIRDGQLRVKGAFNHPLWLQRKLPRNAVIEFDVTSHSPDGDIKVEAWGDGQSHATTKGAYLATSYVFIFGGWGNSKSIIARMDEHAPNVPSRTEPKVETGKTYHWKIRRKGNKLEWYIDGKLFLKLADDAPLEGARHAYFGFNNWQSELQFDNLVIRPL